MINPADLIVRIKEEQHKLSTGAVLFPSPEPLTTGVQAGKWQGLEMVIRLIDEILHEEDKLDR